MKKEINMQLLEDVITKINELEKCPRLPIKEAMNLMMLHGHVHEQMIHMRMGHTAVFDMKKYPLSLEKVAQYSMEKGFPIVMKNN